MKILGTFQITYSNGISQVKNLISHEDYESIVKPIQNVVGILETDKKTERFTGNLKKVTKGLFGDEWFTDKSPLYDAIKSGKLDLPVHQGGIKQCKIKRYVKN